jgi:hypothetical protein
MYVHGELKKPPPSFFAGGAVVPALGGGTTATTLVPVTSMRFSADAKRLSWLSRASTRTTSVLPDFELDDRRRLAGEVDFLARRSVFRRQPEARQHPRVGIVHLRAYPEALAGLHLGWRREA